MFTSSTPRFPCPRCGKPHDEATAYKHDCSPQPGDFLICIDCGALLRFTADLRQEALGPIEIALLPSDLREEILTAQVAIRIVRGRLGLP